MVKKRIRKNYYKNSRAHRREQFAIRLLPGLKVVLLALGFAAATLLLVFIHDAVTQSSYFAARSITVNGNKRISRETILKQAGVELRDNILCLNVNAVRTRILVHPWIADVEVERELPDAIHIQVKEYVPMALIDLGEFYYIAEDGKIFNPVAPSDRENFPLVSGLESEIDLNDPWRCRLFWEVMEALRLSRPRGKAAAFQTLHELHVDKEMGLTLHVSFAKQEPGAAADYVLLHEEAPRPSGKIRPSPVTVKMGFGDYGTKYTRLRQIVSQLGEEGGSPKIQCIDLNDANRVVVRPIQEEKHSVAGSSIDGWRHPGKEV